jgi:hypothetical protein
MRFSNCWFFRSSLEGAECFRPHLVEVRAQPGHAFRVELIESPGSGAAIHNEARILEHLEMLRDRGTGDRHGVGKLVDGKRPGSQLLKDSHAGSIPQGIETGL